MLKGTIILVLAYVATVYCAAAPNLEARATTHPCAPLPGHPSVC